MDAKLKMLEELMNKMDETEGEWAKSRKLKPEMTLEVEELETKEEEPSDLELPEDKEEKKKMILKRLGREC